MKPRRHPHPIRSVFETWLARSAFMVIPALPRRMLVSISRILGVLGYWTCRSFRRVGMANLNLAFGMERTVQEKRTILRQAFTSFALLFLDTFWFSRQSEERIARHVHFSSCFDSLFNNRAQVCITAHYGNWEVMGMAVTLRGFALHSVAKPLQNPEVDRLFIEARKQTGQKIIRREGAVRGLLRALQHGEKVALVLDQNTRLSEGGIFVPFFGLPVLVSPAPAALAIKTRSDVFIGIMTPGPDGDYFGDYSVDIPIAPYLSMTAEEAIPSLSAKITSELEAFLRLRPHHWAWFYKRWKYIPQDFDASLYPYYAQRTAPPVNAG